MKTLKTYCGRMDHGGCGLVVNVENNKIVSIKGDPEAPLSRGYMCLKGRWNHSRLHHPNRLKQPLLRKGDRGSGCWKPISWDNALDLISERFLALKQKYGARSVIFSQGSPKGLEHFVMIRLANTFGSPNIVGPQNTCHMPREISARHTCGFFPVVDYSGKPSLIIVWGSNLTSTNEEGVICSRILSLLKQNTRLIVIDPRETELARRADLWLRITPGSDTWLALSFIHQIIKDDLYDAEFVKNWTHGYDELLHHVKKYSPEITESQTGISPDILRKAARMYAEFKPAAIQWGNGIEQTLNNFDCCRAIICMMALTGNIDCPGSNIEALSPPVQRLGQFVRTDCIPSKIKDMILTHANIIPGMMINPPPLIKKAIVTGSPYPIKGAYVQVSNPVIAWSGTKTTIEALKKLDFFVVSDLFMTPTAALADLVLPVASQFEINDIGHYGLPHGYLLARPKLIDPPEQCKADIDILNELGKRLTGPDMWWANITEMLDDILEPSGLTFAEFCKRGILQGPIRYYKYKDKGFKTPSGKIELCLSKADRLKQPELPQPEQHFFKRNEDFPLLATSRKSRHFFCSANRESGPLRSKRPYPFVEINPDDAEQYNIQNNEKIVIETEFGQIYHVAQETGKVAKGVICLTHGWWFPEKDERLDCGLFGALEANINAITSSECINKSFGTPQLRAIPCQIRGTGIFIENSSTE